MAAKHPRLGLDHLTVIPPNFEPSTTAQESADEAVADSVEGHDE